MSEPQSGPEVRSSTPFDALAGQYDDTFTNTAIGSTMRRAVWRRMEQLWPAGSRLVELNCGTGVDAAWLMKHGVQVVATDAAAGMVVIARGRGIDARELRAESIAELAPLGPFDGALSNFGGLNCVEDLRAVVDGLGACLRPGATALLCVMGPVVPWEWAWYVLHGKPRTAFRRFARVTSWRGMRIEYPSIRTLRRICASSFEVDRVWALGALIPPSYAESWAHRHPRTLGCLASAERLIERWPGVAQLADHYVIEVTRR